MKKKVLLTGGSGFIGRYVKDELKKRDIDYLSIDSLAPKNFEDKSVQVSLLDEVKLKSTIVEYKPDVIIHLAAIALVTYTDIAEMYKVNVVGTEILLKTIREVCPQNTRVVLISTAGVYGNQDKEFYNEDLPYNPANHYSYTKMIDEMIAKQYKNLDIKIVRPFNIIGVGQKNSFLIPKLMESFIKKDKEIHLGNIKAVRDYISVNDAAYIIVEMALRENVEFKTLNICSGKGNSVEDIIKILENISGFFPNIIIDQKFVRDNEVWRLVGDSERINKFLKNKKIQDVKEICEEMYTYLLNIK